MTKDSHRGLSPTCVPFRLATKGGRFTNRGAFPGRGRPCEGETAANEGRPRGVVPHMRGAYMRPLRRGWRRFRRGRIYASRFVRRPKTGGSRTAPTGSKPSGGRFVNRGAFPGRGRPYGGAHICAPYENLYPSACTKTGRGGRLSIPRARSIFGASARTSR